MLRLVRKLSGRCGCGCGQRVLPNRRFVRGHNSKVMTVAVRRQISLAMLKVNAEPEVRIRRQIAALKAWRVTGGNRSVTPVLTKIPQKPVLFLRKIGVSFVLLMNSIFKWGRRSKG